MRGFALVVATAALVAGCGGNSNDSGSRAPAATTQATSTQTAASDPQAELDSFLADFKALREEGIAATDAVEAALDKVNTSDEASMVAAGKTMADSAQKSSDLSNEMAALVPPDALAKQWAAYVSAGGSGTRALDQMATDLKGKDVASIASWESTVFPGLTRQGTARAPCGWR